MDDFDDFGNPKPSTSIESKVSRRMLTDAMPGMKKKEAEPKHQPRTYYGSQPYLGGTGRRTYIEDDFPPASRPRYPEPMPPMNRGRDLRATTPGDNIEHLFKDTSIYFRDGRAIISAAAEEAITRSLVHQTMRALDDMGVLLGTDAFAAIRALMRDVTTTAMSNAYIRTGSGTMPAVLEMDLPSTGDTGGGVEDAIFDPETGEIIPPDYDN